MADPKRDRKLPFASTWGSAGCFLVKKKSEFQTKKGGISKDISHKIHGTGDIYHMIGWLIFRYLHGKKKVYK